MIPSIGYIALVIAFAASLLQSYPPFKYTKESTAFIFALTTASFICLVYAHSTSDFSVLNVYNNSHTAKPFIYKISGTWGNHEGSMLLLALMLSAYNFFFSLSKSVPDSKRILCLQGLISSGFYAFIIFTSNPFQRISPVPENGLGLNPLLQDIGLALHPPILYVGYIGLSLALTFSISALISGKIDKEWAGNLKKWVAFSWAFLTLGVGLGSWWAYRELGWGGFWFWDPVENASLMPWLSATALLHALAVTEKRGSFKIWTVLLGILTFSLCLLGIFLVRSGILTSVHSFASDPSRGFFILAFLGVIVNASLILFAIRAHKLVSERSFSIFSKEGAILFGNLLLSVACFTVILGTLYPILIEIFSDIRVSVGAPYFNATFAPITLPLLVLAAITPALKWQSDKLKPTFQKALPPLIVGLFAATITTIMTDTKSIIAAIAIAFSAWLIAAMLIRAKEKFSKSGRVSNAFYAMALAHIGVAILTIGITASTIWGKEKEDIIKIGESIQLSGYEVKLQEMFLGARDNFLVRQGVFYISDRNKNEIAKLKPEVRYYPIEETNTTESAIYYSLLSNLYIAMGESDSKGGFVVRVYHKPMINLIWAGCVIMFIGGMFAAAGRRKGK